MNNKTEIDLSESKQLLIILMDLIPGIVYVYNQKGEKVYWNKQTEDIIGHINDNIEDFSEMDLLFSDEQKKTIIKTAFEDGVFNVVTNVTTQNGEEKVFSHIGIIANIANKKYLIGTGIDITELKLLEIKQRVNQCKIIKLITKIGLIKEQERKKLHKYYMMKSDKHYQFYI
jgi:PAS domain S-box-containing protein